MGRPVAAGRHHPVRTVIRSFRHRHLVSPILGSNGYTAGCYFLVLLEKQGFK